MVQLEARLYDRVNAALNTLEISLHFAIYTTLIAE
jgi:hypothetical protein